ncbi:MAG: DUF2169 domain-containing protein [Polyangiaceae bacterium]
MRIVKPQSLAVAHRVIHGSCKHSLAVAAASYWSFDSSGWLHPEIAMWSMVAKEVGGGPELDTGMPKLHGELLLTARAYAPRGPCPALPVRVQMGTIDKTLWVVGDRTWDRNVPGTPVPFTEMPLDWAHAFGGPSIPANPTGKGGATPGKPPQDTDPLPNIEDPKHLVRSRKDRPPPAGLGAYDASWPQRAGKAGTFDAAWLRDRYPALPLDADPTLYNVAPPDQWIAGRFAPGTPFRLENVHPTRPMIESRLPALQARCFVHQQIEGELRFLEVPLAIETVHLFPHLERGIVLWRGTLPVADEDADDIVNLIAGVEAVGASRPAAHYEAVLHGRLDKERGFLRALRDSDLMPEATGAENAPPDAASVEPTEVDEMRALLRRDGLLEANLRRRADAERDRVAERLCAEGLDPAAYLPAPTPPPPPADDLEPIYDRAMADAEAARAQAELARADAEAKARASCAEHGIDYDQAVAAGQAEGGGPPRFSAHQEIERLEDLAEMGDNGGADVTELRAALADPALRRKLEAAERSLRETYLRFAQHFAPARLPDAEGRAALRADVIAVIDRRASLRDRDLTGADLSQLDLTGADFRGAILEGASFAGAELGGADFSEAVAARADFTGASLSGARFHGANLAEARLVAAVGAAVDFRKAVLAKADLAHAVLRDARLDEADLSEARFQDTDLTGATAPQLTLLEADLRGVHLERADLREATLLHAKLTGVRMAGARLPRATLLEVDARDADLRGIDLEGARVVLGGSFDGANLAEARLGGACLRETSFVGADLSGAHADGADFTKSNLTAARLTRAVARGARLSKADLGDADLTSANLMDALLPNARLSGARLEDAHLFRADMLRVRVDGRTRIEGAAMEEARLVRPVREAPR